MFLRYKGKAWEEKFLPRLTSHEIRDLDKEDALVVLSIGAVEQHGAHLPVMTDSLIGESTLTDVFEKLDASANIWMLPPISYGKSNEHLGLPGTISLSAETLSGLVMDIAKSLKESGFRRLLLFNTHGGNTDLLLVVAREIRIVTDLMVFFISPGSLNAASDLLSEKELEDGIHGGAYETSIVKSIKPCWVHDDLATSEFPDLTGLQYLTVEGKIRFAWKMTDISRSGIAGDATIATAQMGATIQERISDMLADAFVEMASFEITQIVNP
ncbi:creatininase family protein [Paenibacillus pinihumi]|uniref:creatininase family protein n=1 Tax=Paenibacillus pinihumi TaxID=669462 RepID=UPI000418C628|nr:creatininase family protein [Paenibacillus pinihumi]